MSGIATLAHGDSIVLRDQASSHYLQAGHDIDGPTTVARLVEGNLIGLQPTVYFRVLETRIKGFWMIKTATGKFLKVGSHVDMNHNRLIAVDMDPASDLVVDKSPYYFSFIQVPGTDAPILYVLGTYMNGGMTLQQPEGFSGDLRMSVPHAIPGTYPEVTFEIAITAHLGAATAANQVGAGAFAALAVGGSVEAADAADVTTSSSSGAATAATAPAMDGWSIAFIVLMCLLVLLILGYVAWAMYRHYAAQETARMRAIYKAQAYSAPAATPTAPVDQGPAPEPSPSAEAEAKAADAQATASEAKAQANEAQATAEVADAKAQAALETPPVAPEAPPMGAGHHRHQHGNLFGARYRPPMPMSRAAATMRPPPPAPTRAMPSYQLPPSRYTGSTLSQLALYR
jgi:hypothetical protein